MAETIAVLFVFFILVTVGFIFYVKVIKGNIDLEKEELSQLKSIGIAQRVMFLPEVQCSEDNIIIDNCVDILKIEYAKLLMRENEVYYYDALEFSDISIAQIYPNGTVWNVYSRKTDEFSGKFSTNVPISLYNPNTRKHGFGVLTIDTFVR